MGSPEDGRMADPRLGPDELDRLEDALEGLEALDDLGDPSEAVSNRLADFQFILRASREALPLEDVRPGVLEGVFSEARMSSTDIRTPVAEPPRTQSVWTRLRKAWLIPALAVAGSAALVLILVKPMVGDSPELKSVGAVAAKEDSPRVQDDAMPSPAPASEAPREAKASATADKAVAGKGDLDGAAPPPPAAAAPTVQSTLEQRDAPQQAQAEPEPEPSFGLAGGDADANDDKPTDSEKGWNAIEQGDSAREGGDCFSARNHYARALDDGNDSVRARAYVGMGLCKRDDGNTAAADEYFDKARELDEDAVKFADTRAEDEPPKPTSRKPKKKASRKRKSSMDFEETMDPFKSP